MYIKGESKTSSSLTALPWSHTHNLSGGPTGYMLFGDEVVRLVTINHFKHFVWWQTINKGGNICPLQVCLFRPTCEKRVNSHRYIVGLSSVTGLVVITVWALLNNQIVWCCDPAVWNLSQSTTKPITVNQHHIENCEVAEQATRPDSLTRLANSVLL